MVDPYCTVYLKWASAEGYDWRGELAADDVRVLAGRDYPNPLDPDEPWGLSCLHASAATERVATPVWDWGRYYELIVRSIQDDRWRKEGSEHQDRALNYWWGMNAGVVRLELGEGLAAGQRRMVQTVERAVLEGRLHPFEDILVTHAPARGHGDLPDPPHQGFDAFNGLLDWLHPKVMLHGHVHLDYGMLERERVHRSGVRLVNCFGWQEIEL